MGKRVFLADNVHNKPGKETTLIETRWAMNYLTGPLTRSQIPALNQMVGAIATPVTSSANTQTSTVTERQVTPAPAPVISPAEPGLPGSTTQPVISPGIAEYFLPNNLSFSQAFKAAGVSIPAQANSQGILYRPALLAQAHIRFNNRKYNLDYEKIRCALVHNPDRLGASLGRVLPNYPG